MKPPRPTRVLGTALLAAVAFAAPLVVWRQPDRGDLRRIAEDAMAVTGVPAAAVIVLDDHGTRIWTKGAANQDRAFLLGSTAKSITALALDETARRGLVDLDAPVASLLPWFHTSDPGRSAAITLWHLSAHTSGLPQMLGWQFATGQGQIEVPTLARELGKTTLRSSPGERFEYSNANYVLLGHVLEAVHGKPIDAVLEELVFEPLQMTGTSAGCPTTARRHRSALITYVPSHLPCLPFATAAGYVTTTPGDVARYLSHQIRRISTADRNATLVSAERPGFPAHQRYRDGWYIGALDGQPEVVSHGGDVFDSSSFLLLDPARNIAIGVVTDASTGIAGLGLTDQPATAIARDIYAAAVGGHGTRSAALRRWTWLTSMAVIALVAASLSPLARRLRHRLPGTAAITAAHAGIAIGAVGLVPLFFVPMQFMSVADRIAFWTLLYRFAPDITLAVLVIAAIEATHAAVLLHPGSRSPRSGAWTTRPRRPTPDRNGRADRSAAAP